MIPGIQNISKLATDLTNQVVMKSQSKYVKEVSTPVGNYQPQRQFKPTQRYGANRRINRPQLKLQGNSSINSQSISNADSMSQTSNKNATQNISGRNLQKSRSGATNEMFQVSNVPKQQSTPQPARKTPNTIVQNTPTQSPKPAPQNDFISDMFNKNTNTSTSTRYGANRRTAQNQKAQQIIQKYQNEAKGVTNTATKVQVVSTPFNDFTPRKQSEIKQHAKDLITNLSKKGGTPQLREVQVKAEETVVVEKQTNVQSISRYGSRSRATEKKPDVVEANVVQTEVVQVKPNKPQLQRQNTTPISRYSFQRSEASTPKSSLSQPISTFTTNLQQTPSSQIQPIVHKPLARSNARTQIRQKQPQQAVTVKVEVENQDTQQSNKNVQVKKRSNVVFFILKKLFRERVCATLGILKRNSKVCAKICNVYAKILARKLSGWESRADAEMYKLVFKKLVNQNKPTQVSKQNVKIAERMSKNSKSLIFSALQRRYANLLSSSYQKLKKCSRVNPKSSLLVEGLNKLYQRKVRSTYNYLKDWSQKRHALKNLLLVSLDRISKQYRLHTQQQILKKILKFSKAEPKKQKTQQKGSPIHQFQDSSSIVQTPESSPQRLQKSKKQTIQLQGKLKQNKAKIKEIEQNLKQESIAFNAKKEQIKMQSEELEAQNQEKKKITEELKQKASEIQYHEEDYIDGSDVLLIDTKFPTLSEIYMKVQKSHVESLNIDSLKALLPGFAEEAARQRSIQEWIQILNNAELTKQISKYEGQQQGMRKGVKLAQEEQQLLTQLVKGYIKQKYTWQWVKNALAHIPHN